jgi:hypothetical protein
MNRRGIENLVLKRGGERKRGGKGNGPLRGTGTFLYTSYCRTIRVWRINCSMVTSVAREGFVKEEG